MSLSAVRQQNPLPFHGYRRTPDALKPCSQRPVRHPNAFEGSRDSARLHWPCDCTGTCSNMVADVEAGTCKFSNNCIALPVCISITWN